MSADQLPRKRSPEAQVRRCPACGEAKAVLVDGWGASATVWVAGGPHVAPPHIRRGTFRCQSCGESYRWRRSGVLTWLLAIGLGLGAFVTGLGVPLFIASAIFGTAPGEALQALACVMSAFIPQAIGLALLLRRRRLDRRWPPVEAPRPRLTLPSTNTRTPGSVRPDGRRCECGASAPVAHVVQERLRGVLPIGKVYEHSCSKCGVTFNVHDAAAVVFAAFAASFLSAAGVLLTAYPPGAAAGAADSNRWFGVALLVIGGLAFIVPSARIVRRLRHPISRPTEF